ncbi:MAG: SIMPL domain-containing protein [Novosphingobium sp.]
MRRSILFATALTIAAPAAATEIQIAVTNPVVEMAVNEVVQSAPDTATIGAGVTTRAASASEAMRLNAAAMERVVARVRALGIPAKDIQTSSFSLNAQYQYVRDGEAPKFLGYDASNQVSVTLRDLVKVGETLDALVAAGANNLYGPNFTLEKDQEAKSAARRAAFARAQALAGEYARMAGFNGLRLLEVSEAFTGTGPLPVTGQALNMSAAKDAVATPVEPGRVGTGVQLVAKFEMTK